MSYFSVSEQTEIHFWNLEEAVTKKVAQETRDISSDKIWEG